MSFSTAPAPPRARTLTPLWLAAMAAVSFAGGVALVAVAARFGSLAPVVAIAIPLVPLAMVAIMADQRLAIVIVFLTFAVRDQFVHVWIFNIQAIDFAVLTAAALVLIRRFGSGVPLMRFSWPLAALLALAFWALALVPSAENQTHALKQAGSLLSGLVVALVVVTVCSTVDHVRRVLAALVAVGAALTLPVVAQGHELQSAFQGALVVGRPVGIFVQPNELGVFCLLVGFAAAGLALGARSQWGRYAATAALAVLFIGLVLSLSRAAWLGAVAGMVFMVLTLRRVRRGLVLVVVPIVVAAVFFGDFAERRPEVRVITERVGAITSLNQPYDDRSAIYSEAIRQLESSPLTGVGPGNFSDASRQHVEEEKITVEALHAHNIFLNTAAELGVPGLLMLLGLTLSLVVVGRQTLRALPESESARDRAFVVGLESGLLALVVAQLFHVFVGNAILDATVWTLVASLLVCWRDVRSRRESVEATMPTAAFEPSASSP
jgi:O-antigen ligase